MRKKCADPEIENLCEAFEAMDTNNTGKISFENFLLNSGMKGEVFKGFNRRAGERGVSGYITFPKLVKIVFPKLAHKYQTHELHGSMKNLLQSEEEAGTCTTSITHTHTHIHSLYQCAEEHITGIRLTHLCIAHILTEVCFHRIGDDCKRSFD